jgi:hypothetical protein
MEELNRYQYEKAVPVDQTITLAHGTVWNVSPMEELNRYQYAKAWPIDQTIPLAHGTIWNVSNQWRNLIGR